MDDGLGPLDGLAAPSGRSGSRYCAGLSPPGLSVLCLTSESARHKSRPNLSGAFHRRRTPFGRQDALWGRVGQPGTPDSRPSPEYFSALRPAAKVVMQSAKKNPPVKLPPVIRNRTGLELHFVGLCP